MDKNNIDSEKFENVKSYKEYFYLVRNNWQIITIAVILCTLAAGFYSYKKINIYESTTSMRISKPHGDILTSQLMPDIPNFGDDRFISNEIDIMKSYNIRLRTARALLDSFYISSIKDSFYIVYDRDSLKAGKSVLAGVKELANIFGKIVSVDQKRGLDIATITVDSPSPYEAALIANIYAQSFKMFNLEANRNQLTLLRKFLEDQASEKQKELTNAENKLSNFQVKGGIIALDDQAKVLIQQLANFQAARDATDIDLKATQTSLIQLKAELSKLDPKLADYLESMVSQSYIQELQDGIAKLQVNKDLASANTNNSVNSAAIIREYDQKISDLKQKLHEKLEVVKAGILASSPNEIKDVTRQIMDGEVKTDSLQVTLNELNSIVKNYESKFNTLPATSIEYARYERQREAAEKLYSLIDEKYQEAVVNEQSQPGNVLIIDSGLVPDKPSKPNRPFIILIGFVLGFGLSFAYVLIMDYIDDTVKTPEEIEGRNINLLCWIPLIEEFNGNGRSDLEFIVSHKSDARASEAFKVLRTRVQYSKIGNDDLKTILVTSAAPGEGKTTVAINLAGTFALAKSKTLIIDADLRKPRMHRLLKTSRSPGLVDCLFRKANISEIVRKSDDFPYLYYITVGTLPPNPSELLGSKPMNEFLIKMRSLFDVVILDSAPLINVTDSEVLSRNVDGTMLVTSANITEMDMMEKAVQLLKHDGSSFLGVVLNKFTYTPGYSSYYKYYYYYSNQNNGNGKSNGNGHSSESEILTDFNEFKNSRN